MSYTITNSHHKQLLELAQRAGLVSLEEELRSMHPDVTWPIKSWRDRMSPYSRSFVDELHACKSEIYDLRIALKPFYKDSHK